MSEIGNCFESFEFCRQFGAIFQPKSANISLKAYWIMNSLFIGRCQHFDSKTIQKTHTLHKNEDVEVFQLLWSHSEMFLKQNAAIFSSTNVMRSSFFPF